MRITRSDLDAAAVEGILDRVQADRLWDFLCARGHEAPPFRPPHILYYLGGLVAISAVTLFVTLAWHDWAGLPMLLLALGFAKLGYCLVNLLMVALGAVLMRRVFAVFGGLGITLYLGHLAGVFSGSLLFPVVLAAIGLGIIFAGLWWQRHERALHETLLERLPAPLRALIARAHGG